MPRKSSFLMGFETGQDLYNKGFSQAQQAAQMKQRNQQLKLQQDSQAQRGKLLDMQLRGEEQRLAENTRQLNVAAVNRKTAAAAVVEFKEVIELGKTQEARTQNWYAGRSKYEQLIFKDPDIKKGYETWKESEILDTISYQTIKAEKEDQLLESVAETRWNQTKREGDFKTRDLAKKITGKDYPGTPEGTATAQSDIFSAQARGMYIKAEEDVPENLDLDGDGRISAAEVDAAEGDVVGLGRSRAATLLEEKRAHDEKMVNLRGSERVRLESEKQKGDAAVSRAATLASAHMFGSTPEQRNQVEAVAVFGGGKIADFKIADEQFAGRVQMRRSQVMGMMRDPKANNLSAIDIIRMSGVNEKGLGDTPRQQLNKAFAVREQIAQLKAGGYIASVDTGKISAKMNKVAAWFNTKGSKDVAVLNGLLNTIIPNLARGIYGEIGVLTDKDIETYKGTFVGLSNDEFVNEVLYDVTKKFVNSQIERQLVDAATDGYDVSARTSSFGKLTGTHLSPHIEKMISPGGGGQGDMRPGGGSPRPSAPPVPAPPQVNGQNFDTDEDAATAAVIMAASLPPGTPFTDVTVAGAARNVVPNNQDVREWAEQYIGRQYDHPEKGWTDYVDRGWIEKWEKEDKAKAPTPEATTPKPTEPEEVPSARRMDPSVDAPPTTAPEPTAPEEPAMEPTAEPNAATEMASIVLANIDPARGGNPAGILRRHLSIRHNRAISAAGTEEEKLAKVNAFIDSLKGLPKADFMRDMKTLHAPKRHDGDTPVKPPPAAPVIKKPSDSSLGEVPSEESSDARKQWEKDKLKSKEWYDTNYPDKDNFVDATAWMQRDQALKRVGKTITVRGEKFTVLEAGKKGMLVTDDEGNEYYILKSELPKEIAPPAPRGK